VGVDAVNYLPVVGMAADMETFKGSLLMIKYSHKFSCLKQIILVKLSTKPKNMDKFIFPGKIKHQAITSTHYSPILLLLTQTF
jgi:hypothetical protein